MEISQKIVVITGTSRGLGLTLAEEFASNGWLVIGTGRSVQSSNFPTDATYKQFDASDAAACEALWKDVREQYPDATYCLVNNAGGYISGNLTELKPEDYMQQMQSIYFSAAYMTRGLINNVPKGKIINVISSSALGVFPGEIAYGAAKAAEQHFFQVLQSEVTPDKYAITNIYPDNIASHGPDPASIDPTELAQFVRQQAENNSSYYVRDVTIYPIGPRS